MNATLSSNEIGHRVRSHPGPERFSSAHGEGAELVRGLLIESDPRAAHEIIQSAGLTGGPSVLLEWAEHLSSLPAYLANADKDVILLDLEWPGNKGLDAFHRVRELAPTVPIIVVLGSQDQEALASQALEEGACDYLVKEETHSSWLGRSLYHAVERHRLQSALEGLSRDTVTGLYNRTGFMTVAEQILKLVPRSRGCALLCADIEHLLRSNRLLGYLEGNRILWNTANVLRQTFRQADILARVGGDEFVVLALNASRENAPLLARRLQKKVDEFNVQRMGQAPLALTVRAGWIDPKTTLPVDALMNQVCQLLQSQ